MARPRNKEQASLSTEDRLKRALVPVEEQPYPVPENWCWVRLGEINFYISKNINPIDFPLLKFELYSVPSSIKNYPELLLGKEIGSVKQQVEKNDVLICKINPRINRVWHVYKYTKNMLIASSEWIVFRNKNINHKYINYYMSSPVFRRYMVSNVSGVGGSLMRAQPKFVAGYPVPIPSLAEQQRIVDRIESLFSKLDEARDKAQAVLDTFESRKDAILHKAFTGELTKTWREEHGVGMESWKKKELGEIGQIITGSTPNTKQPEYYGSLVPFVKPTDLNAERYILDASEHLSDKGKSISRPVRAGSTCVCCIGATISKCGYLLCDVVTNQQINSIVPYDYMSDLFVYYYCSGSYFKQKLIENSSATTLPIINKSKMSHLKIVVPLYQEQQKIARILDDLFAKERRAREAAEKVLEQIDLMKKAILAKAFRGELGTNDPTEARSVELLQR